VVNEGAVWPLQPAVYDTIESNGLQKGAGVYRIWIYTVNDVVQAHSLPNRIGSSVPYTAFSSAAQSETYIVFITASI
jgi:hypothetical protein